MTFHMRDFRTTAGVTRRYGIVSPAHPSGEVFLWLHGSMQSATVTRRFTRSLFDAYTTAGVTVLYPEGVARHWNDGRVHLKEKTRELETDDVGFLTELVGSFQPTRVLAAGFSNGGHMIFRLLHEAPGLLSKAAVIAATQPVADNFLPTATNWVATDLLIMHGTADPISPFDGGIVGLTRDVTSRGLVLSAPETVAYYAHRNGSPNSIAFHPLSGVGHVVPGPDCITSPLLGPACTEVHAAKIIAEFFGLAYT